MAIDPNQIMAAAPAAPTADQIPAPVTPATASEAPAEADTGDIPDEVLRIPAFQALLEGKPPAIYEIAGAPKIPGMEAIPRNIKKLAGAGINLYKSLDSTTAVLFNTQFLSLDDVKKADKEGKLTEIAEPAAAVVAAYNTVLGGEAAPAQTAPEEVPSSNLPTPVEKKITTARLKNLSPGSPTSGPAPGGGRVLNNVLKRAV